jgi:membrane-associated phospholipid phosphatase
MFEMSTFTAAQAGPFEAMYVWGIAVIHAFQSFRSPALTLIARIFTTLGDGIPYAIIIAALFWCIDERRGFLVGMTTFLSNGLNAALKSTFSVPRPFTRDAAIQLVDVPDPFSTPSGHAQNSAAFWPTLFGTGGKRKVALRILAAVGLPLCIGASRVYLGVHYPTDVLLGWAIGSIFAVVAVFAIPAIAQSKNDTIVGIRKSIASYQETTGRSFRSFKLAAIALIALVMNATAGGDTSAGGAFFGFGAGFVFLTDRGNPGRSRRGEPLSPEETASAAASQEPEFSAASGSTLKKIARFAIGLVVLFAIHFGLKLVLPGEGSEYYALSRFLRYGLVGFWISFGAPRAFQKIKLA